MKIRSQLVLAFLLLAVLPLTGIVLYSYASSRRAVRQAVETEAALLTEEMQSRMTSVQQDLKRRVERVGRLPLREMMWREEGTGDGQHRALMGRLLDELGEAAALVRTLEFVPAVPPPPAPRAPDVQGVPPVAEAAEVRVIAPVVLDVRELMREAERGLNLDEATGAELKAALEDPDLGAELDTARQREHLGAVREHLESLRGLEIEAERLTSDRERLINEKEELLELYERELQIPIQEQGRIIGAVRTEVSGEELLRRVLDRTRREQGEIPFALDSRGALYVADETDRETLRDLSLSAESSTSGQQILENWVIVTSTDPSSGLTFGIARPIRESLEQIRRATARNFGFGVGLIALALVGIVPLTNQMTRGLKLVTSGAESISRGDLHARVPVHSRDEIGQLAQAFNSMARDLQAQRDLLLQEERRRRDQEVEQQLLTAEFERKSQELEEARSFQLSLLPRSLPRHPDVDIAVDMRTATEVGGDYYDFRKSGDGTLVCAVGDATGHGARAGTMVTVIKSLFSAYTPEASLSGFLSQAAEAIRRMELGRMAMALTLVRIRRLQVTLSSAGMPPPLLYRAAAGEVEELTVEGMPLGGLDFEYVEREVQLSSGDVLLLMSDGFPELPDSDGEPLGYGRAFEHFDRLTSLSSAEIIEGLFAAAEDWAGEAPPADDMTFLVLRAR